MSSEDNIWIYENKDWKKGKLISEDEIGYLVESKSVRHYAEKVMKRNEDEIDCQNNLIDIPHLNEPSILNAINLRFNNNIIYTYTGKILISINPFKNLDLYSDEIMKTYKNNLLVNPHIYQIANDSFVNFKKNQTILVSGESGAGKTHATRSLMKYLAYISSNDSSKNIEKKVIQSNPILEAFGNAKTIRNDNSSRFGKFIKLQFNENNKLLGSEIETYLLEKIRVVNQSSNERNFHIFYQLLSSDMKDKYFLKDAKEYNYLNNKFIIRNDDVDDSEEFNVTLMALKTMGFLEDEIEIMLSIISSILHIGNIKFSDNKILNSEETINNICKLLNIDNELLESSILHRYLDVQGEIYKINLDSEQVDRAKKSLSMKLYDDLFTFIVKKINENLDTGGNKFIGILDIFGFESFEINRFEQLCINYTNETLQQQFNKYVFELEQIEYEKEGINWKHIDFPNNQECLNLISGKLGLIELLNEECRIPKGSSINFTKKFIRLFKDHKSLSTNKKYMTSKFSIKHYAGPVEYDTIYFYEKNNDKVSKEINDLVDNIKLFTKRELKKKTVMIQFRKSLNDLMKVINQTCPHYIRCIKPNDLNKSNIFDRVRVNDQLKYSGILEAVKVARAGYPIRFTKEIFNEKYFMLDEYDSILISEEFCKGKTKIFLKLSGYDKLENLKKLLITKKVIIIQKNVRMYLIRSRYKLVLNNLLKLQTFCRIIIAKKKLLELYRLKSAIILQKNIRSYLEKKRYLKILGMIKTIQKIYRLYRYNLRNKSIIIIQSKIRSINCRNIFLRKLELIRKIQFTFRRYLKIKSRIKNKNKILEKEISKKDTKIKELLNFHENFKSKINNNLSLLKDKVNNLRIHKEKSDKQLLEKNKDINYLEDAMRRSINEKMELSRKLEELMIENDRIRKSQNNSLNENCLLM